MDRPALLGGGAVTREDSWPRWPQWDDCEASALQEVLESGRWQSGPQVEAFEREFAGSHGAAEAICVTNGTASLEIALRALGVGPGDEVIVPSYTFAATALAVMTVGAQPVFVDAEPETLNIDPSAVWQGVSERTRAVIPVHLGGHPVDLDRLLEVARSHSLAVIEDAAHAHGAEWRGTRIGAAGECASFSFQTGKSMTSGDGGCITTDSAELAEVIRSLSNFGRSRTGELERVGSNNRMTEFQAAILRCSLRRLDEQIAVRQSRVARLRAALRDIPGVRVAETDPRVTRHPHYQVLLHFDPQLFGLSKAAVLKGLAAEGVPLEGGYEPLHLMPLFRRAIDEGHARMLPCTVSERAAAQGVLWLSFRMALASEDQIDTVAQALKKLHHHAAALAAYATTAADAAAKADGKAGAKAGAKADAS
ncbi:MAG: DegT/DnrJ/EryC1/StrS family aminotransferase [Trueperaceae bacterium]